MTLKVTLAPELIKAYPQVIKNQCTCLKNTCSKCGTTFPDGIILVCPKCNTNRERCRSRVIEGEDVCPAHNPHRAFSMYQRLAANISDASLEEFIEKGDNDLTQEFALARLALSGILDGGAAGGLTSKDLLENLKMFFDIALKKKRIETGDTLNIKWDDKMAESMRKRWRQAINSLADSILRHITVEVLRPGVDREALLKVIFQDLKNSMQPLSESVSLPPAGLQGVPVQAEAEVVDAQL